MQAEPEDMWQFEEMLRDAGATQGEGSFVLTFEPLYDGAVPMIFHCDRVGNVDVDALGDDERNAFLLAQVLVGRDYHPSEVARIH